VYILHLVMLAISLTLAMIFAYLAIISKDLLMAVVFSAAQSVFYALVFYLLLAPDIVLAFVAVSVGIYSALLIFIIRKTERYEKV